MTMNAPPRDAELRGVYLFAGLDDAQLARVRQGMRQAHLNAGERLFDHGQRAEHFFLVYSGKIKLFRLSVDGNEKVIEIVQPGATFAEAVMFMEGRSYPVSAEALEASVVLSFDNKTFLQLLRESTETCFLLMADMSMRLHQRLNEIDALTLKNASVRLISYILQLVPREAEKSTAVELPAPKNVLASRLSIQPETFSRILHNLTQDNLIRVDGKTIHIDDLEKLRHYGG